MNTDTLPCDLQLARKAVYTLGDAAGIEVVCREGSIWLTLDNDQRDYVLEPGESFVTGEHRRAVVYALGASRIDLVTRQSKKPTMEIFNRFHASPLMKAAR